MLKLQNSMLVAEDLERWERDLENFPEYKAKIEEKAKERSAKQQERAAKKQILNAAKKRPTRPGKLGLPKPKPIVKRGKLTRNTKKSGKTDDREAKERRAAARARQKVRLLRGCDQHCL